LKKKKIFFSSGMKGLAAFGADDSRQEKVPARWQHYWGKAMPHCPAGTLRLYQNALLFASSSIPKS
jgi:hypothetical protein